MSTIAAGLDYTDVRFLGFPHIIATAILQPEGEGTGVALVDPGPQTTLDSLKHGLASRGISLGDVTDLVVTHIHLDHSGAAGHLVHTNPRIKVHVHEVGAPHLVDPTRLLSSAAKLYGDDMARLWGDVWPVPAPNINALGGGERIQGGGRDLLVAYTPGHARHHVSYLDEASGVAFVGDTFGVRRPPSTYVMPPTPPPDVDLPAWRASLSRILEWNPSSVFLTHFGLFEDVRRHAHELLARLDEWTARARTLLANPSLTDAERSQRFVEAGREDLRRCLHPRDVDAYDRSGRIDYSWEGLARAIRKEGR